MSVRINARLDEALSRKVEALRRRDKTSLTEIVKRSLDRFCDAELAAAPDAYRALQEGGFIGCADGPADLSSSYKDVLAESLARKT